MLAAGPLGVIQQVGVVLQGVPHVTACKQMAALRYHEPQALVPGFGQPTPQQNLPAPREQWELSASLRDGVMLPGFAGAPGLGWTQS